MELKELGKKEYVVRCKEGMSKQPYEIFKSLNYKSEKS